MSDLNFETKLQEKDISTSEEELYFGATINWGFDLDIRSWGLKDIDIYVKSVVIEYEDDTGAFRQREFSSDNISLDVNKTDKKSIYPISIYYTKSACEVSF